MMLEDLAIGWREALLGIIALLILYVAVVVIRLRRLRAGPAADDPVVAIEPPAVAVEPPLVEAPAAVSAEPDFPWNEPPDAQPVAPIAADAILLVRLQAAEGELATLRDDVVAMRGEIAELRADLGRQLERVQASQHVAPVYGDAMQMAVAGYDATAIAERCGVARAEAELVVALIRNRDNDDNDNETMRER